MTYEFSLPMSNFVCLVRISVAIAGGSLLFSPQKVSANPGNYGMQMCSMMRAGTSQKRAWDYIVEQHTMRTGGQMGGFGIAAGIIAGQQLRSMRGDVFAVARANCPEAFGGGGYKNNAPAPKSLPHAAKKDIEMFNSDYCRKNPWERKCNIGNPVMNTGPEPIKSCSNALQKYDCKYSKYLEANPHMQDWVNSNPEMARKEALRLKAVDAEQIGAKAKKSDTASTDSKKDDVAEICLKAADYKGCMEYNKSN